MNYDVCKRTVLEMLAQNSLGNTAAFIANAGTNHFDCHNFIVVSQLSHVSISWYVLSSLEKDFSRPGKSQEIVQNAFFIEEQQH